MLMPKQRKRTRVVLLVTGILAVVLVAAVVRYRDELVAWYAFWRDFEGLGKNEQGYPEYRHRQTGIVFVRLPGGTSEMGSPEDEQGRWPTEGPIHGVTLSHPRFLGRLTSIPGQRSDSGSTNGMTVWCDY